MLEQKRDQDARFLDLELQRRAGFEASRVKHFAGTSVLIWILTGRQVDCVPLKRFDAPRFGQAPLR